MLSPNKRISRSNSDCLLVEMVQNSRNLHPIMRMAIIADIVHEWEGAVEPLPREKSAARAYRSEGSAYIGGLSRSTPPDGPDLANLIQGLRNV